MADINIKLTEDIDVGKWNDSNPGIIGVRINEWHRTEKDNSFCGLSQDALNIFGSKRQIVNLALRLLQNASGKQWIEASVVTSDPPTITPEGIVPIDDYCAPEVADVD